MAQGPLGAEDLPALRGVLLGLVGQAPPPTLPEIDAAGWQALDRIADLHRIRPLLHHRHHDNPAIPADLREGWHQAWRASAMQQLILAGELANTVRLLEQAGLAPLALKGAWLAWHAYPHPALRPMRDLDLLLCAETVIPAFDLLLANGYRLDGPQELPAQELIRLDKHMPPLISPRGAVIELHQRLWEIDGRMDHAAPSADLAAIRARAIRIGAIGYLAPADLLAHLIIHAVYDHRLDCGPLVLSDIAFLLERHPVDWTAFWAEAAQGGWQRGARLVLELVRRHAPTLDIPVPADVPPCPQGLDSLAPQLLLQELETRQSAGVVATFAAAGWNAALLRVFARRKGREDTHSVPRDLQAEGGFAAWLSSRLTRTLRDLVRRDVRDQSRDLARLSRWLDA